MHRAARLVRRIVQSRTALAGIVAFSRDTSSKKTAHMGSLGAMYVRAGHRGQGVGDALIDAVLEEAAKYVEQLTLTVNAENKSAHRAL